MTTALITYCDQCGAFVSSNREISVFGLWGDNRHFSIAPVLHFCGLECLRRWVNKRHLTEAMKK